MKRGVFIKVTVAILALSCAWAKAQTNALDFADPASGLSLRLPAGWVECPKDSIHRAAGFGAKLEPTPPPREFLAVFWRGTDMQHPAFPRIAVQFQKAARVGEIQFRGLHAAPLVEITVAQSLGFAGNHQFMRSARYDTAKQCLAFGFDRYIEDLGFVRAVGRSFLTRDGLVNIYGYAIGGEFDGFQPEFEKVVSTLQVSSEHRYQPGSADRQVAAGRTDAWKDIGTVLGLMLLAGIGWMVYSRMCNRVGSDEI